MLSNSKLNISLGDAPNINIGPQWINFTFNGNVQSVIEAMYLDWSPVSLLVAANAFETSSATLNVEGSFLVSLPCLRKSGLHTSSITLLKQIHHTESVHAKMKQQRTTHSDGFSVANDAHSLVCLYCKTNCK